MAGGDHRDVRSGKRATHGLSPGTRTLELLLNADPDILRELDILRKQGGASSAAERERKQQEAQHRRQPQPEDEAQVGSLGGRSMIGAVGGRRSESW